MSVITNCAVYVNNSVVIGLFYEASIQIALGPSVDLSVLCLILINSRGNLKG